MKSSATPVIGLFGYPIINSNQKINGMLSERHYEKGNSLETLKHVPPNEII